MAHLPFVDEHTVDIEAGAADVWRVLLDNLDGAFAGTAGRAFARAVGCDPSAPSGPRPLATGATIPGFRVAAAVPGCELSLEGRHRFSTYALTFRLDELEAGPVRLRAESRAVFPGPLGAAYRLLVISSGGHVLGVTRMLGAIRERAERRTINPTGT